MKILLVGNENPHFVNTIVLRRKAVEYLGHELISFDDRRYLLPGSIREKIPPLHQWDLARLNSQLVDLASKRNPDICIVVGGHRVLPETVKALKKRGVWTVLWTTDVPLDFRNILAAAGFYDHLFCAGSEAVDIFHQQGHRKVTWLPFACDQYFHQRIALSQKDKKNYGRDMAFIGSYYPNRAKTLESVADLNVGVWGPYWQKLGPGSKLKEKAVDIKMNYDQWVKIYNASKVILVIHYQDPAFPCHQISPKLFEAMACGSFVLTDRQKDAAAVFKDREHLVFFDNEVDMRQKALYYLAHDDQRNKIAGRGHEEVLARHRYQDRIQQILEMYKK